MALLHKRKYLIVTLVFMLMLFIWMSQSIVYAESNPILAIPDINIDVSEAQEPEDISSTIQVIMLLTVLALAPSILVMMTCFTRIIIILSFLRKALALQTTPPNQVLIGLALFLTFFYYGTYI